MRAIGLVLVGILLLSGVTMAADTRVAVVEVKADAGDLDRFSGKGTPAEPYVLSGTEITAAEFHGIQIENSNKHYVIRDVSVAAGGTKYDGIRIVNSRNVTIERADLQFNRAGVVLANANGSIVRDSTIRASQMGIVLEGTSKAQVLRNIVAVNDQDVVLRSSQAKGPSYPAVLNVFRENKLSIASGQWGFSFAAPNVYNNDIDETNVVNFEPVQWYTNRTGTASSPQTIGDKASQIRGITNVGQIVCYHCSHVRFEQPNTTAGAANGLVLEDSNNITITRPFAEGNALAGIEVRNSTRVTITAPSAYANLVGLRTLNATNVSVTEAALAANQEGVRVQLGASFSLRSSLVENNTGAGVVLFKTNRSTLEKDVIRVNGGDGIKIEGGSGNTAREELLSKNGGAGVNLLGSVNASVSASTIEDNKLGGVFIGADTLLSRIVGNKLAGNGDAGIRFASAGALNRVDNNELAEHARHFRFTASETNELERNAMTAGPNETGLWFDDETSYNNNVSTTNTVNGTPVQWHVALVGSAGAPVVLRDMRVETPNMTNVAQIMVYKGSYVRVLDAAASGGPRGIYVLRSSSFLVDGAELSENGVGIELRGAQTGEVKDVRSEGGNAAVLLAQTINVTLNAIAAPDANVSVLFADTSARGSVVDGIDSTGVRKASIVDPSATTREPRHLIADAGLDKLAGAGSDVTFNDTLGVARFGSERIVAQTWDFGDGESETSAEAATLRPTHVYAAPGDYVATYTLETADGRKLTDTVNVRIVEPAAAPDELVAKADPAKRRVNLAWEVPESDSPILSYRIYRGTEAENLTFLEETTENTTLLGENFRRPTTVFYAVSAVTAAGEGNLSEPVRVRIEPAADDDGNQSAPTATTAAGTPLGAWVAVAAIGIALLASRRRR